MEYYYIRFAIEWIVWLTFADKKRWREILPVCFFASLFSAVTDTLVHHYPLWMFDYSISAIPELLDDFGIYIVVTYLFIQWLPSHHTLWRMLSYWFVWTSLAISIEFIHLKTGHMTYHQWWKIWYSYIADWILFWIFYQYYKAFKFEKLSQPTKTEAGLHSKVKRRFKNISYSTDKPTLINMTSKELYASFGLIVALNQVVDLLFAQVIPLYYMGPDRTIEWYSLIIETLLRSSLGLLYLNFIPSERKQYVLYLIGWIALSITFEWIEVIIGYLTYTGWTLLYSTLFYFIFYLFLRWHLGFIRSKSTKKVLMIRSRVHKLKD
jgi:hypothetical protein